MHLYTFRAIQTLWFALRQLPTDDNCAVPRPVSKIQLPSELQDARIRRAADHPEGRTTQSRTRSVEPGVIDDVKGLGAHFQLPPLFEMEDAAERQIKTDRAGSVKHIPSKIPECPRSLVLKRRAVEKSRGIRSREINIGKNQVRPVETDPGLGNIRARTDVHWNTGAHGNDG